MHLWNFLYIYIHDKDSRGEEHDRTPVTTNETLYYTPAQTLSKVALMAHIPVSSSDSWVFACTFVFRVFLL